MAMARARSGYSRRAEDVGDTDGNSQRNGTPTPLIGKLLGKDLDELRREIESGVDVLELVGECSVEPFGNLSSGMNLRELYDQKGVLDALYDYVATHCEVDVSRQKAAYQDFVQRSRLRGYVPRPKGGDQNDKTKTTRY